MPHHLRREEGGEAPERKREHKSVMTAEVLSALAVKDGDVVVALLDNAYATLN